MVKKTRNTLTSVVVWFDLNNFSEVALLPRPMPLIPMAQFVWQHLLICYSGSISAVSTRKHLLGEKRMCAKFQGHVHIYKQTDERTWQDRLISSSRAFKYFTGSPKFLSWCYKLKISCLGYKNIIEFTFWMHCLISIHLHHTTELSIKCNGGSEMA